MIDLTICQDCKKNPAVYGDGLTWARCSSCELKRNQDAGTTQPEQPEAPGVRFEHKSLQGVVSIILPVYMVNYSLFHYTGNCIGSIREHTNENDYELIVVDNGSPITPPELDSYYADKVIVNEKNLGVTRAWNQGIRASFGEYICLLNNDVQVFEGWLEEMVKSLEYYDLVMAHPMYSLTEPFARAVESYRVLQGDKKLDPVFRDFSCVVMKKSLLDEVGLFDEDFFNYCSDSEFFDRLDAAGKTYKVLDHVATSHISDATGYSLPETPEIMNKDTETYANKKKQTAVQEQTAGRFKTANESVKVTDSKLLRNLFRSQDTGDSIYFMQNGTYHRITDPDTLHALGFEFGDEDTIQKFEISWKKGEDINMQNYEKYIA